MTVIPAVATSQKPVLPGAAQPSGPCGGASVRRVHVRDERLRHRTAAEAGPHLVAHAIEVAATIRRHRTGQTCNRGASCLSYQRRDLARAPHRQVTWRPPRELVRNGVRSVPGRHTKRRATGGPAARTPRVGPADSPRRHQAGCRQLAIETLPKPRSRDPPGTPPSPRRVDSHLNQPEKAQFIDAAVALQWTLAGDEAQLDLAPPISGTGRARSRKRIGANQQAPNLADLARQPTDPERG
jgi:hypothetical protein